MSTIATSNSPGIKSGGLESVKYYVFDGEDEERWNEYSIKTLAFAETKGWKEGLTDKNASDEKKKKAKNYLTMSLTGKAFRFINQSRNADEIWNALIDEYAPTEAEDRYDLEEEFKQCFMEDPHGNPTDWFNMLDEINSRFCNIENGKFQKSEEDMKLHIRMNLPEELYSEVITSFKDYSSMTLRQVKKEIRAYYRRLKRSEKIKETKVDKIMQVEVNDQKKSFGQRNYKPRWKKPFKGTCHYCGEQGHKAFNCPKRKSDNYTKKNSKPNIECFICGKNHYANQCPLRKEKIEQAANMFVGTIYVKEEAKVTKGDYNINEKEDETVQVEKRKNNEENKVIEELTEEKKILAKKINEMSHKDRIIMTNNILSNVGTKTIFVPENENKVNSHIDKIASELLNDWIKMDFEILEQEYYSFIKEKLEEKEVKDKNEDWKEVRSSSAKSTAKNEVQSEDLFRSAEFTQVNYYDSLSEEDDSDESCIIEDRWKNEILISEEVDTDTEESNPKYNEKVNITIDKKHIDGDHIFLNNERKIYSRFERNNHKRNMKQKLFHKQDIKSQWLNMKKRMDALIEQMETINIDKIKLHTNQIDRICARRNNLMNIRNRKKATHKNLEKELRKAFLKPNSGNKYWIHSVQSRTNESWLADSGASVHVTNSCQKMFNVIDDDSTIVVGTGKETKATKKGDLMLVHNITNQRILLKNVLYVPSFEQNIISIPTLMKNGFSLKARNKNFELVQNRRSLKLKEMDEKGLFYFVGHRIDQNESVYNNMMKKKQMTMDINLAHDAFNHLSPEVLRKTCKGLNIKLTGNWNPCPGCMYAKAKQKNVKKITDERAKSPGERLFIDTSGPYPRSMGGNIYWMKVVDDYSRKNWNFLMKKKSEVAENIMELITSLKNAGKEVKYLRCDNAGEHNTLIPYCIKNNITLEMTTPNTPQHNGVVERSFATELNLIRAMLFQANFTTTMISSLWGMAVMYLETTKNMSSTTANENGKSPNCMFGNNESLDVEDIQPFERMGFVTIRTKIKKKLAKRSFKAFMVGKPKHHSKGAFYMYNPKTRKVIISRDIQWAPFQRPNFMENMDGIIKGDHTSKSEELDKTVKKICDSDSDDDENITVEIFDQGGRVESNTQDKIIDQVARDDNQEFRRMEIALKKLNTSLNQNFTNPSRRRRNRGRLRSSPRLKEVVRQRYNFINAITDEQYSDEFIFNTATTSDPNTPATIQEALNGNDADTWSTSIKSEINNFLKRKSWEYVFRDEVIKMGRKIIPCKWVFKIKQEIDNTIRYKTRLCVKGFHQIPGIDFTESFSPVASGTTIVIVLLITLWKNNKEWKCEMFDVEAAFLNAELEIPMYLEWPEEIQKLGFITEEEKKTKCIKLIRSMYGNVDAALRWMKAFVKLCTSDKIDCKQSKVDPCLLYKKSQDGELILLIAVYVDDVLIAGKKDDIDEFRKEFQKTYKITDLGNLKRHLGIWFEWIESKNGERVIKMHMDDMATKIVKEYEKLIGGTIKEWATPGYPSIKLSKPETESEIVDEKNYRSMVGKVMYFVNKVCPVCLSVTRELAKYFACPTQVHWKVLTRLVGYIKGNIGKGRLLKQPKEMRIVAFTDSDYANGEDRKSVTGGIVTLGGVPTNAMSKTQAIVSLSSTEAEYIALSTVAQEVMFQSQIMDELIGDQHIKPSVIFEDNLGAIYLTKNSQVSQRTKHIDVRHHFIRTLIDKKVLDVKFVKSRMNTSDVMTKNVKEDLFLKHEKSINGGMIEYNEIEMCIEDNEDILVKSVQVGSDRDDEAKREDVKDTEIDEKAFNFVTKEKMFLLG